MTKSALIAKYVSQVAEMVATEPFVALLETVREECPYVGKALSDPTSIVRNEGMMQGWYDCLKALKTMHEPIKKIEKPRDPLPLYQDPIDRPNPNQK